MNSELLMFADNVIHTSDKDLSTETIASVVITGISVVFIGLVILIFVVWLYGMIFQALNKRAEAKKAANKPAEEPFVIKPAPPVPAPDVEDGIEEEIVAVISAAIAAYGAQTGKKLAVRSIKSAGTPSGRNAWSAAGLSEATRPF